MVSMPNGEGVSKYQLTLCTVEIMLMPLWVHIGVPYTYTQRRGATSEGEMGREDSGEKSERRNFSLWYFQPHLFASFFSPILLPLKPHLFLASHFPGPMLSSASFLFFFFFELFIYFWVRWVFIAARGLPLVVASGVYSLLRCAGFSLR